MTDHDVASAIGEMVSEIKNILKAMNVDQLKSLTKGLIATLPDTVSQKNLLLALNEHIKNHLFNTAFFVVGIVLLRNPLALAGFGALGPAAVKF